MSKTGRKRRSDRGRKKSIPSALKAWNKKVSAYAKKHDVPLSTAMKRLSKKKKK